MDIREEALQAIRLVKRDQTDRWKMIDYCRGCIGWGIAKSEARQMIEGHLVGYPLKDPLTDDLFELAYKDALDMTRPGEHLELNNYHLWSSMDEKKKRRVPRNIGQILEHLHDITGNRIAKVDNVLFADDPETGIHYFAKHKAAGLFGYLHSKCNVVWQGGSGFVTQAELFAELERTAKQYNDVETIPHEPRVEGIYYGCASPKAGTGERLQQLLAFFSPASDLDAQLIKLLFLTAFWGGPPGTRPLFVVTSDDGRGAGKTSVFKVLSHLIGGMVEVSANADMGDVVTRLLSPGGQSKRLMLLDNVKTRNFSWAELEALVTSPAISGKRLYCGEGQRPNLLTIGVTLNGVNLSEDIAQRAVVIKVKRPAYLGAWFEEVFQFVDQFRDEIIDDIISALQGARIELEDFTRWGTWESNVLALSPEANELRDLIVSRQHESNCDREEAQIIEDAFAEQLKLAGIDPADSVARIPNSVVTDWFGRATNERLRTQAVTRKMRQMSSEGQLQRLRPDSSRSHGRCWLWIGQNADENGTADNRLLVNLATLAV